MTQLCACSFIQMCRLCFQLICILYMLVLSYWLDLLQETCWCSHSVSTIGPTPVFKKRPNFLNTAPTSTEGALRHKLFVRLARRMACPRAQFSGRSSTTNAYSDTGHMAVCCQNLPLGVLSSRNAPSVLVGALFKKFGFFSTHVYRVLCGRTLSEKLAKIPLFGPLIHQ